MDAVADNLPADTGPLDVVARVPSAARYGDRVVCAWQITNRGVATIAASFYVRSLSVPIVGVACTSGRTQRGRYHGSAAVIVAAGRSATTSVLLEPLTRGEHPVRTAVVTDDETLERVDVLLVE